MAALFDTLRLGPLQLNNRIALAPLTRCRGTDDYVANAVSATYYAQRASGGLLITEGTPVNPQGVGYLRVPGIWNDAQQAAWREITDAVHAEGGRIFAQIWHVGRVSHNSFQPNGQAPVAPSAIQPAGHAHTPEGSQPLSVPQALTTQGIDSVIADFVSAARRASDAGFDGVEIHGANGYLLEQFLYTGSNHRTDEYGGSLENRARFTLAVVDAVVAELGTERVGLRLSPQNTHGDASDANRRETYTYLAQQLKTRGLVYLHILEPVSTEADTRLLPMFRESYDGVIITNAGYDKASAEAVLAKGEADMVAFGVAYLANPDLPARLRLDAPLNPPRPGLFYSPGAEGYTDYPTLPSGFVRLVALEVTDRVGYEHYRSAMQPLLASYGGQFILDADADQVRTPKVDGANRVFMLSFPSEQASEGFFADERYLAIKAEHFAPAVGAVSSLGTFTPAAINP